ncbi:MAG TPA: magnesium transporter CorA family protein [Phycisphaerales bacterium]|nr:magnesium transporter CorA family protein [Phycisphaerales bacterium]
MRQDFTIDQGRIVESIGGGEDGPVRVYSAPTPAERAELMAWCDIDEHSLNSALDPEEVPRVEVDGDHAFIIWKRPDPASYRTAGMFEVSSVGIVLHRGRLAFVTAREPLSLGGGGKRARPIRSLHDLALRELLEMMRHYVEHLRAIKAMAREVQTRLNMSIGNEHLLRMFSLGESLVYYVSAIEANGGALVRLRASAERLGFTAEDTELLDDVMIENTQCARQAAIYSQVLSGLMDARGNIINNNMNMLLKNLTVISVMMLPVGLLTGIGGMSEFTAFSAEAGVAWWVAYPLLLLGMGCIGLATWFVIHRWMERVMGGRGGGSAAAIGGEGVQPPAA